MFDMIGVVLWRDAAGREVLIWCDRDGEIALFHPDAPEPDSTQDGAVTSPEPAAAVSPGDLVVVDMAPGRRPRRACRMRRLDAAVAPMPLPA